VAHAPEPQYCDSRRSNTAQGEGRACIAKKEEFKGKKTIDDAQSEDGKRPQGYQKERDQKGSAESRTSIEATRDRQRAWT